MSIKIQKPTIGRIVEYTSETGGKRVGAIIGVGPTIGVKAPDAINIRDFNSLELHEAVSHNSDGAHGTWRYPPHVKEEIEVER